ncbi:hypothetical protein PICSAR164_02092 [Mycobacterium avium subsp. paratuberculosis]|nr:hypothetical protein PICSAR164_02092 [Mycobacterium avium subsp. paratuberculosis]
MATLGASATAAGNVGGLFDASTGVIAAGAATGAISAGAASSELRPMPSSSGSRNGAVRIAPQVGQPTALKNTW